MANTSYKATEIAGVDLYKVYDPIDSVTTNKFEFALGKRVKGADPSLGEAEFIFLKGVATCVEGHVVTFRPKDHTAILLAANAIGGVAVALAATVANKAGWFQLTGKAVAKVAAAFADNGLVYATATGGVVDDAAVAGDRVKNAIGCSAIDTPVAGFAYLDLYPYPFMDDATAA